jgi:hypothetical protein
MRSGEMQPHPGQREGALCVTAIILGKEGEKTLANNRKEAPVRSGNIEDELLNAVFGNPQDNTTLTAQQVGISHFSVSSFPLQLY